MEPWQDDMVHALTMGGGPSTIVLTHVMAYVHPSCKLKCRNLYFVRLTSSFQVDELAKKILTQILKVGHFSQWHAIH